MIGEKPSTLAKTLSITNKDLYSYIYAILSIRVTMPSSSATAERSLSAMTRIQNYIRSTMGDDRLSSLAPLHIYREIEIDVERVIELFASLKNRKLALL
jgi:histone deacetylase complex regulatory component SIN3